MKNNYKYWFLLGLLIFTIFNGYNYAQTDSVEIVFFYEAGCPHCARVDHFLKNRIEPEYPVQIKKFEIHNPEHAEMLSQLAKFHKTEVYTPTVFIGDTLIKGDERTDLRSIEEAVRTALRTQPPSPLSYLNKKVNLERNLSISVVLSAAAVDAVNPCAFAVLTLLLGTILLAKKRKRYVIKAGLAFTTATLISYLLMGFGLYYAVTIAGIQQYIYIIVSILAILIGLGNMKDYIWPQKWFKMEVPESWRPKIQKITSGVTSVPGAFGIGFIISIFLLPCTSGPYVVIIGMLSESASKLQAIWLLIIYNLIFIMPFIIITLGVGFGLTTTARIEKFRQQKIKKLHLITGIVMFAIGAGLITLVLTGNI